MRKYLLMICMLITSATAMAQFEKGTWILNPSFTGLNFSHSDHEKVKVGINVDAGCFLADGFALMVRGGADWSKPVDKYTLGTGGRAYFNKTGIYLGAGVDLSRYRYKGGSHDTAWRLGLDAGYAFFIAKNVTIEPAVYYNWCFNDNDFSEWGLKVGFALYF